MSKIPAIANKLVARQTLRKTMWSCFNEILSELQEELTEKSGHFPMYPEADMDMFRVEIDGRKIFFTVEEVEKMIRQNNASHQAVKDIVETLIFEKLGFN